jgi:hypothetical protein
MLARVMLACLLAAPSVAAQSNYRATPTGGRSALLGDTGIALATDGASPFLNPATMVRIHDASLAFSVSFFSYSSASFGSWHQPGAVDTARFGPLSVDASRQTTSRFDAIPSTLCLFFTVAGWGDPNDAKLAVEPRFSVAPRTGRQKLAACLGTTQQEDLDLPAVNLRTAAPGGISHTAQSFHQTFRRVHVGPSYGIDVTDAWTLGVSLHGVISSYAYLWSSSAITSDASGAPVATSLDATGNGRSIDLDAIFGATYRAGRLTFGASAKPPAAHVGGSYDASLHQQSSATGTSNALLSTASGDFRAPSPARIGVGVGADLGRAKLEVDATYFFPLDRAMSADLHVDTTTIAGGAAVPSTSDVVFSSRARPVVDAGAGLEMMVSPTLSILGGLSSDITSAESLGTATSVGAFRQARISRIGLSAGLGSYGTGGTLLIGARLSTGWGQALAVNPYVVPNEYATVDARTYGAMLVVAGSTSFRALKDVVESVGDAVTPRARKTEPPAPPP